MKKVLSILCIALLLISCGKDDPAPIDPAPIEPPAVITLSAPAQNSICITGTAVPNNKSEVELKWNTVNSANSYTVTIKDLLTGSLSTFNTVQNKYLATLDRNTPYAWSVAAQFANNVRTIESETWKFYNAGSGVVSYAPFPADQLKPAKNDVVTTVDGKASITWKGTDADGDILNYDVYLGLTATPPLLQKEVLEPKLEQVLLKANATYYWKVVTRDRLGNTSESDIVLFSVK